MSETKKPVLLRIPSQVLQHYAAHPEAEELAKRAIQHIPQGTLYVDAPEESFWPGIKSLLDSLKPGWNKIPAQETEAAAVRHVFAQTPSESLVFFPSLYPLHDTALSQKLEAIHDKYIAEVSFVENAPEGLCPLFVHRDFFTTIEEENLNPETLSLREFTEKNINLFQAEVHFEDPDYRMLRLDFSGSNVDSLELSNRFLKKAGGDWNYSQIDNAVKSFPEILLSRPWYFEIELSTECNYACNFCPRTIAMPQPDNLSTEILDSIVSYIDSLPDAAAVALGGLGEPMQHPQFSTILEKLLNQKKIHTVVLETNGQFLQTLHPFATNHAAQKKLNVIININSLEKYSELHGAQFPGEQLKGWAAIIRENPVKTYMQVLKITDNEEEIDSLYSYADQHGFEFLFQKYNNYAGLMPQRRVSDMTPLERTACWHLRRDLFIRANGDVAFCKQDVQGARTRGNLLQTSLPQLYSSIQQDWKEHAAGQYNEICAACDEYYTFNL